MHIKQDENHKKNNGQGKSDDENWRVRSPEEVLGEDKLVEGIALKDIPDGKRVELHLSKRGVKKLYDEGVRVAKHDGFSRHGPTGRTIRASCLAANGASTRRRCTTA